MSKDIVIQKAGVPVNITVSKIYTNGLDQGNIAWMPEDDTGLEELSVTENGEYTPDAYGFSKVTVDVENPDEPVLGSLTVTENGNYNAHDYGYDAFDKIKVDVHGDSEYERIYFYSEPTNAFFKGQPVDLTGVEIHAVKTDGTEIDITDECMFVPKEGAVIPEWVNEVPLTVFWTSENKS